MSTPLLDAAAIRSLLADLDAELAARGVSGELYLVGGAAIALAYDESRATRDLDAVFAPKAEIYQAAHRVAQRRGIELDWLNDAVKGLVPGDDPGAEVVFDRPNLTVSVGSPQHLLAMKVAAARVDRDESDIKLLARQCGCTTTAEVLAVTTAVWGNMERLLPKWRFMVEELFTPAGFPDG